MANMANMRKTTVAQFKDHLSADIAFVEQGGEIVLCRRDKPVARLVPYAAAPAPVPTEEVARKRQQAVRMAELERLGHVRRGNGGPLPPEFFERLKAIAAQSQSGVLDALLEGRYQD